VPTEVSPAGILAGIEHARHAVLFELVGDVSAVPGEFAPLQRVGAGTNRLAVGRHVHARAVRAHLMVVDIRLRLPVAVHDLGYVLRLHEVQIITVSVVVVAGVRVVQKRQASALILRAQRLPIPVDDHDLAVRVDAGQQEHHGLIENAECLGIVARHHVVGDRRPRLRPRHLRRMQAQRLRHDSLALGNQPRDLRLGHAAWVGEHAAHLRDAIHVRQILGRRDDDQQKGIPFCGRAEVDHVQPVTLAVEQLEVVDDPVPAGKLSIGAQLMAEEICRRCHRCL